MNNMQNDINASLDLLKEHLSFSLTEGMRNTLEQYLELLMEWNSFARLVSKTDEKHIVSRHVVDSLSLVNVVEAATGSDSAPHLDIGAGGGFPVIPMAIALPGAEFVAMERSAKKSTFLRKAASDLSLSNLRVIPGMFPESAPDEHPSTITARAVENPERMLRSILNWLPSGCTFLCQSSDPQKCLPAGFDCTVVRDAWTDKRYRRGALHLICRVG